MARTAKVKRATNETEITEMSFIESKLTATDGKRIVSGAYEQLMRDKDKGFSEILSFIITRLMEEGNPLANMFIEYCLKKNSPNDTYRIAATYDVDQWSEKSLENLWSFRTNPFFRKVSVNLVKILSNHESAKVVKLL